MIESTKSTVQQPADARTQAVDRELESLKRIDPGADNPETRIRLEREWDEEEKRRGSAAPDRPA